MALRAMCNCERGILRVREDLYDLQSYSRVLVISLGKAGHTMVEALTAQVGIRWKGSLPVRSPAYPGARIPLFSWRTSDSERGVDSGRERDVARSGATDCFLAGDIFAQRRRIVDRREADR